MCVSAKAFTPDGSWSASLPSTTKVGTQDANCSGRVSGISIDAAKLSAGPSRWPSF
jgi:hypothetical protein